MFKSFNPHGTKFIRNFDEVYANYYYYSYFVVLMINLVNLVKMLWTILGDKNCGTCEANWLGLSLIIWSWSSVSTETWDLVFLSCFLNLGSCLLFTMSYATSRLWTRLQVIVWFYWHSLLAMLVNLCLTVLPVTDHGLFLMGILQAQ